MEHNNNMKGELHRQLPPVRGYPAHSAPASPPHPPPSNLQNESLWAISLFFLPMPKIPSDFWALGMPLFVLCPKSQDFLNFSQKKQRFLGTGEKKRLIYPISSSEPHPYPPQKEKICKKSRPADQISSLPGGCPFYLIQFPDGFRLWPGDCPPYSQAPARQLFCRRSLLCLRSSSSSAFSVGDPEYDLIAVD